MFPKDIFKRKIISTQKITKIFHVLLLFVILFCINLLPKKNLNLTNNYNKYQTLNLLVPSDKCIRFSKTLYFFSKFRNIKNIDIKIVSYKIKLQNKAFFVFYYLMEYYKNYSYIFEEQGLIKNYNFVDNNILITDSLYLENLNEIKNKKPLNKYQKIFHFKEKQKLFNKDKIYITYNYMKNLFSEDFNFMPETFNFPENKEIIFQNLKIIYLI